MNEQWREALHAVGRQGATPAQLRTAQVGDELLQHLLVAGLVRIDRLNHPDRYGALATQPAHTVSAYRLTSTGAEAIGLREALLVTAIGGMLGVLWLIPSPTPRSPPTPPSSPP